MKTYIEEQLKAARAKAAEIATKDAEIDRDAERIELGDGWHFAEDHRTTGWWLMRPDGNHVRGIWPPDDARAFAAAIRRPEPSADVVGLVDAYGDASYRLGCADSPLAHYALEIREAREAARAALLDAFAARAVEIERLTRLLESAKAGCNETRKQRNAANERAEKAIAAIARLKAAPVPDDVQLVRLGNVLRNFHHNSCYPEADPVEVSVAVDAILRALSTAPAPERREHWSDCALHNGPAMMPGPCDCGVDPSMTPGRYGSEYPAGTAEHAICQIRAVCDEFLRSSPGTTTAPAEGGSEP